MRQGRGAALLAVLGAGLLGELAYGMLLFPLLQHYLVFNRHLPAAYPGYVLAAYGVARLTLQVPLGGIADAMDRRLAVAVGYCAVLAGGLATWSPGPALIVPAAAALFGAGHALADPLLPAALAEGVEVHHRGRIMGAMNLTQVVGLVIGLAGGAFITDLAPASAAFITVTAANAGALVLLTFGAYPLLRSDAQVRRVSVQGMVRSLTRERALDIFAVLFLLALAMNMVMPNVDTYSVNRLHQPLHRLIPYLVPAVFVAVIAMTLGGWLADRRGRLLPLFFGPTLACLGFIQLGLTRHPAGAAFGASVGAAGLALSLPASNVALLEVADREHRALVLSGMMAMQGLGQAVGPLLGGLVAQAEGAGVPFLIGAGALWLSTICTVLFVSTPHDGEPGEIVRYTPLMLLVSRLNIRLHERRTANVVDAAEADSDDRVGAGRL